eukprot:CAMPEP_0172300910 /NCGR_PEP_ID=MMETSP1058-20130122/2911_1 /TAXON_ID=83371 /ORGANISM="Detonula confervacea, Strain CCMP 353" /LENGTH=374 /DNA_ID=CAMNT_0013010857 /DNA_START=15 /DNA_END=1139 /DNA_ORIENTATION=+
MPQMKSIKEISSKSKRQQQQKERKSLTTPLALAPTELSSFSLAAAISEASSATNTPSSSTSPPRQQQQQQQPRKIFNIASQQSLATNTSFATANDQSIHPNENSTTAAASYFVDSSDDEDTTEGLNFGNDPLAVLSRTTTTTTTTTNASVNSDATPTEISFSNTSINSNPEETMPSKKSTKSKITSPVVDPVGATPTPTPTATAPKKDPPMTVTPTKPQDDPTTTTNEDDQAHFDIAQNVYTSVKSLWSWGKSVPIITNLLSLTETIAGKVLDTTVHMDLPALDAQGVTPQLKKLDDDIVSPALLAVWKIIEPAWVKGEEMVIQPVMREVVPRVLMPFGMFDEKKKDWEKKKEEERKEAMIDKSPTPEVVVAIN